jgi:hypothetical protein
MAVTMKNVTYWTTVGRDILEECIASIIRVAGIVNIGTK